MCCNSFGIRGVLVAYLRTYLELRDRCHQHIYRGDFSHGGWESGQIRGSENIYSTGPKAEPWIILALMGTIDLSLVLSARKIVNYPVMKIIRFGWSEICKFTDQSKMTYRIKRFWEVKRDHLNMVISLQKLRPKLRWKRR